MFFNIIKFELKDIFTLFENTPGLTLYDNVNELNNFELINEKYEELKKINFNHNLLDCNYWINKIKYNPIDTKVKLYTLVNGDKKIIYTSENLNNIYIEENKFPYGKP